MPTRPALDAFLKGPLGDRHGGSAAIRDAALACMTSDAEASDLRATDQRIRRSFTLAPVNPLFSYQQEIASKLESWLTNSEASRAAIVSLPTGGGKTRLGTWFYRSQAEDGNASRLLWVAPSSELVEQAVSTLEDLCTKFPARTHFQIAVNHIPSKPRSHDSACAFVTAQLAAKRISAIKRFAPDLLVFDEAHQAVARTFEEIIRAQLSSQSGRALGLSATPGRADDSEGEDLESIFGSTLITSDELGKRPVESLQERGVLSKLEVKLIDLPKQWDQIRVRSTRARTMSLDELALHPARFWATVNTIQQCGEHAKCLVFCASLAHAYALNGALRWRQVKAATLSHNTATDKRASVLSQFAAGDISVVLNKTLLATGYDCPGVTDVVLATPVRSSILWEQILGRASRGPAVGGTSIGRVWELDEHRKLHGKVLSYARFLGEIWQ